MTLLHNYTSAENSFLVNDYPFGFRLRCKIRYWLEFSPTKGVRFCSQTTNPKASNEVWNKPKYSTYCKFGGTMFLDDENHVQWTGVHEFQDLKETLAWYAKYGSACVPDCVPKLRAWINAKLKHDKEKSEGKWCITINGVKGEPLKPELDWTTEETQNLVF